MNTKSPERPSGVRGYHPIASFIHSVNSVPLMVMTIYAFERYEVGRLIIAGEIDSLR